VAEAERQHGQPKVRRGGARLTALVQRRIHVRQHAARVERGRVHQRRGAVVAARELLLHEAGDFEWAELLCGGGCGEERRAQGDATGICLEVHCSLPNINLKYVLGNFSKKAGLNFHIGWKKTFSTQFFIIKNTTNINQALFKIKEPNDTDHLEKYLYQSLVKKFGNNIFINI
jgi:hypothetical protein